MSTAEILNDIFDEANEALRVYTAKTTDNSRVYSETEIVNAVYDSETNRIRVI